MSTRLGVDLGTTWTAAALGRNGATAPVSLEDGSTAMPSVVAFRDQEVLTGTVAEKHLSTEPAGGAREFKRRFGDTTPLVIGGTPYGAEALMAQLLEAVISTAEASAGGPIDTVILTHPANWGEYKLELLRDVGRLAGLDDVELIPEPGAAALHYAGLDKLSPGGIAAIYDFGGGTFDASVVRVDPEGAELVGSPEGLERLGGVDFDQIVLTHVDGALDGALSAVDTTDPEVRSAVLDLRAACTRAKEALSSDTETTVPVRLPGLNTDVRMTREEFEAGIRPRLADTLGALDRAIASANVPTSELEGVLLVGGSSHIPLVAEVVAAHTGRPVLSDADRKQVVVLGAAGVGPAELPTAPAAEAAGPAPTPRSTPSKEGKPSQQRRIPQLGLAARAAAAAGVVGVTGVGGYAAWRLLADEGSAPPEDAEAPAAAATVGGPPPDRMSTDEGLAPDDEPLDAINAPPPEVPTPAAAVFTGTPQGRITGAVFRSATPAQPVAQPAPAPRRAPAEPGAAQPVAPPQASILQRDPAIEEVRAQLRERLEGFRPPEGSDPEDAAKLMSDLDGLLDRYQPYPGQSVEDAIATLRYEFEDRVRDFAQDQRIDAVIAEQEQQILEAEELENQVTEFKDQLRDRLEDWQPPEGADPEEVAELRAELAAMLDRFVAVPGQSPEDALAELRHRFNDEVGDFAQDLKIEALVEEQRDEEQEESAEGTEETTEELGEEPLEEAVTPEDDAGDEPEATAGAAEEGEEEPAIPTEEAISDLQAELERIEANIGMPTTVARPAEVMRQLEADRADVQARLAEARAAREVEGSGVATRESAPDEEEPAADDAAAMAEPVPAEVAEAAVVDVFDELADDGMTVMTAPGGAEAIATEPAEAASGPGTEAEAGTLDDATSAAQAEAADYDDVLGATALEDEIEAELPPGATEPLTEVPEPAVLADATELPDAGALDDELAEAIDEQAMDVVTEPIPAVEDELIGDEALEPLDEFEIADELDEPEDQI